MCIRQCNVQADALATVLRERQLRAVSIGCGEGACEAMLELRGVSVEAVDVDALTNPAGYMTLRKFCREIRRVRADELYEIREPSTSYVT